MDILIKVNLVVSFYVNIIISFFYWEEYNSVLGRWIFIRLY